MKILANVVAVVITVFLLAVAAYAGYWAVRDLFEGYPLLDPTTRVLLAGAAASALVLGVVVAAGLRSAARLLFQGRLVESKRELYRRVLAACRPQVERATGHSASRSGMPGESPAVLAQDLVLLGGPAVIRTWLALQAADVPAEIEARFGELLREMRRELGHSATFEESRLGWSALATPGRAPGTNDAALHSGLR